MPASVPTQDEFNALAARVAKLEGAGPGPGPGPAPGQPSPTGHYITKPADPAVIDDALNAWSLVASGNQQIAVQRAGTTPPPMIDAVTKDVVRLGVDLVGGHRQVVQRNQSGAFYTSTAPFSPWQQIAGPDGYQPPPISAGSIFKVANGQFYKPDGSIFKPTGIDIWWTCWSTRDGGWGQGDQIISDWSTGAPMLTAFPDMNIIRLACFQDGGGLGGYPTVQELTQLVNFCTQRKIVLLLDPHDYSGGSNWVLSGDMLAKACNWVRTMSAAFGKNAHIWCQTQNEPGTPCEEEIGALYDAWRTNSENPCILGWVTYGYTQRVAHGVTTRMHNVGIDKHHYAMSAGSDNMAEQAHINAANNDIAEINAAFKSADGEIPVGCYEFGDACCGHVEQAGEINCSAVTKANFKGWSIWNYCTSANGAWMHDIINVGAQAVKGGAVVKPSMIHP